MRVPASLKTPRDPCREPCRGIIGPREVIQAEIIAGREWREVISADGVRCYVTALRRIPDKLAA